MLNQFKTGRQKGFTIVELLIVMIIIGVLATIVSNTVRDARRQAENTQITHNINQYLRTIRTYYEMNGYYPVVEGEGETEIAMVCLGHGYKDGTCGEITGAQVYESEQLSRDFEEVTGQGTYLKVSEITGGISTGEVFTGGAYGIDRIGDNDVTDSEYGRTIQWVLRGENEDCKVSGSYTWNLSNGNTACEIIFEGYP